MAKWAIQPARGGAMRVTYRPNAQMHSQVWHEAARGSTSADELARWLIRKGEVSAGDVIELPGGSVFVCFLSPAQA